MGFGQINKSRSKFDMMNAESERRFLLVDKKEVDPGYPIEKMFINEDQVYFLTEKNLLYSKIMPDFKMTR